MYCCRIGRQLMGARYNLSASMPSNCPHWNPGPGNYEPLSVYTGGKVEPGGDAPKTLFGRTAKLIAPMDRFSATVFLSNVRQGANALCRPH